MGIQQGSVTLCRFRVLGDHKRPKLSRLNALLQPYLAPPVTLTGIHKEEQVGWVRPVGIDGVQVDLPPDHPWDLSFCQVGDGLLLRMQIERRKVPAQLLQLLYKRRFYAEGEKSNKTPGPKERRELRDLVKAELLGRALPSLSYVDAFWRDSAGDLLLFTAGKKAKALFAGLFQATFAGPLGLTLVAIEPPLSGLTPQQWQDSQVASVAVGQLSSTTPVVFAEQQYP